MIHLANNLSKLAKTAACWKGYEQVGMKMLNGREVPNCVPASKDIPNSKPKKKKTEKKAYGARDETGEIERWLAGGAAAGLAKEDAIKATKFLADLAAQHNMDLKFSPWRGHINPQGETELYDAAKAIEELQKDDASEETAPYFYALNSTNNSPVDWASFDKSMGKFFDAYSQHAPKKKTEKKSNLGNQAASDFIVDVPIKCTPGVGCKRLLTDAEKAEIALAKQNIISKLFPHPADPVSSMISSPGWAGVGSGLVGALGLGGATALGANLTEKNPILYGGLGALLGGLGGGLYGYFNKVRNNKAVEDLMEDLPVGADIGDIEVFSDPKMRAAVSRDLQRQLIRKGLM